MILDVHAYHGNWPYWPLRNHGIDSILKAMDRYGINQAFLCSLKAVFADTEAGNEETVRIVRDHPTRFMPAFTYSPYAPGKDNYREDCRRFETSLVKLFPLNHSYNLLEEPYIDELLDFCEDESIPVMLPYRLMMSWRLPVQNLKDIEGLARKHPQTNLIISSVNYLFELQTTLDIMRRCPNVYLETSGMLAYRAIDRVVSEIGANRLLHGSAMPLQNPAIAPLKIHSSDLSNKDKEKILHRNTATLFNQIR